MPRFLRESRGVRPAVMMNKLIAPSIRQHYADRRLQKSSQFAAPIAILTGRSRVSVSCQLRNLWLQVAGGTSFVSRPYSRRFLLLLPETTEVALLHLCSKISPHNSLHYPGPTADQLSFVFLPHPQPLGFPSGEYAIPQWSYTPTGQHHYATPSIKEKRKNSVPPLPV